MPKIRTDVLRELIHLAPATANQRLLAYFDALEETPEEYGLEFVVDDEIIGNEGVRDTYYAYRYPQDKLPGCTAQVYILAPDDGAAMDAEITRYRGVLFDAEGEVICESNEFFETVAECVAWLNVQLGGPIIKLEPTPDTKGDGA